MPARPNLGKSIAFCLFAKPMSSPCPLFVTPFLAVYASLKGKGFTVGQELEAIEYIDFAPPN